MLPRAACCPTPPSQSLPPISTKGVRTRAFVEIAVSFTNLKCQLNCLAHSFFRRLSPTKETSYPESSSCEEPPQKDCLPTTASFCKESKLYFPFSFLHLKFFVVIFLNSGYRSPVFPSISPSSPWHESMEATWSPISKCSILANLQRCTKLQSFTCNRTTISYSNLMGSIFICNIHIPFKVKFQFSASLPSLSACQTDLQFYVKIDGTCSWPFPYIPFV